MEHSEECREILRRICADAGRRVDSPFCRKVASHLATCEKCRAQAASLRGTLELYRCMEEEEVPEEITRKLQELLGLPASQDRSSSS
jgi:hypothetical protein